MRRTKADKSKRLLVLAHRVKYHDGKPQSYIIPLRNDSATQKDLGDEQRTDLVNGTHRYGRGDGARLDSRHGNSQQ